MEHLLRSKTKGFNVSIPNSEFYYDHYFRSDIDQYWCKTQDTYRIFRAKVGDKAVFTGWDSPDVFAELPKVKRVCHFIGNSWMKGTDEVLAAAALCPEIPITVYSSRTDLFDGKVIPKNVDLVLRRLSPSEIKKAINESLIAVQPSIYEGYGHILHEVKSAGNYLITSDHPPMRDFVNHRFGALVAAGSFEKYTGGQAWACHVDPLSLADEIRKAGALPINELKKRGALARRDYLAKSDGFSANFVRRIQSAASQKLRACYSEVFNV